MFKEVHQCYTNSQTFSSPVVQCNVTVSLFKMHGKESFMTYSHLSLGSILLYMSLVSYLIHYSNSFAFKTEQYWMIKLFLMKKKSHQKSKWESHGSIQSSLRIISLLFWLSLIQTADVKPVTHAGNKPNTPKLQS